ncbi:MAG: hypothetical protein EOP56_13685 [Sphingobacteriales bacterium]|nr:MAG: hypothetical protein EOP56_13685 [Sphingobacteriales bacterium]
MTFSSKLVLGALILLLVNSSCTRNSHYSCVCYYRKQDTTFMSDSLEIYRLGRMTPREAYAACKAYDVELDTTIKCIVEERK